MKKKAMTFRFSNSTILKLKTNFGKRTMGTKTGYLKYLIDKDTSDLYEEEMHRKRRERNFEDFKDTIAGKVNTLQEQNIFYYDLPRDHFNLILTKLMLILSYQREPFPYDDDLSVLDEQKLGNEKARQIVKREFTKFHK